MHEFWLQDFPRQGDNHEVYRVALGGLMPATERVTFKPGEKSPDLHNQSGSIGFMDVAVRNQYVPKEGAKPVPNFGDQYTDNEVIRALTILDIAIEPPFRERGYARLLQQRAEELALEWELNTVVSEMLLNPIMRGLTYRLGYMLYDGGMKAVKRLKTR